MSGSTALTNVSASSESEARLQDLIEHINDCCRSCLLAARVTWRYAVAVGIALIEAKELVPRGRWDAWVTEHCTFGPRTAQRYMRVARHQELLTSNASRMTDLTITRVLGRLARHADRSEAICDGHGLHTADSADNGSEPPPPEHADNSEAASNDTPGEMVLPEASGDQETATDQHEDAARNTSDDLRARGEAERKILPLGEQHEGRTRGNDGSVEHDQRELSGMEDADELEQHRERCRRLRQLSDSDRLTRSEQILIANVDMEVELFASRFAEFAVGYAQEELGEAVRVADGDTILVAMVLATRLTQLANLEQYFSTAGHLHKSVVMAAVEKQSPF